MSGIVTVPDTLPARTSVPTQRRGRAAEPEAYDFRRPMTLQRDHARHLQMAFERFGRQFGNQLTARLRAVTHLTLDGVALRTYDEYVNMLPTPTAMMLCTVTHTRQIAILQLPVHATLVWIDYLFGGYGRGDDRDGRELTDIELSLVKDLLDHALKRPRVRVRGPCAARADGRRGAVPPAVRAGRRRDGRDDRRLVHAPRG